MIKHVSRNSKTAHIETISGCEGYCLAVNDRRVHGPKPWGGGYTVSDCFPNKERLLKIIEGKEFVDVYIVNYGWKGFWIDGVNLSRKGTKKDYDEHIKWMGILKKRDSNKSWREYKKCAFFKVETKSIREALNSGYCKYVKDR